jgi:hypothetical protein
MGVHVHVDVAVNDHVDVKVNVKVNVNVNDGARHVRGSAHLLTCRRASGKFAGSSES